MLGGNDLHGSSVDSLGSVVSKTNTFDIEIEPVGSSGVDNLRVKFGEGLSGVRATGRSTVILTTEGYNGYLVGSLHGREGVGIFTHVGLGASGGSSVESEDTTVNRSLAVYINLAVETDIDVRSVDGGGTRTALTRLVNVRSTETETGGTLSIGHSCGKVNASGVSVL